MDKLIFVYYRVKLTLLWTERREKYTLWTKGKERDTLWVKGEEIITLCVRDNERNTW